MEGLPWRGMPDGGIIDLYHDYDYDINICLYCIMCVSKFSPPNKINNICRIGVSWNLSTLRKRMINGVSE